MTTTPRPFDDERKFIHDLSTPLTTAQLLLDTCIENLTSQIQGQVDPEWIEAELARLRRIMGTLQNVGAQLQERRSKLIAASK